MDMPNVDVITKKSWKDTIEPIDTLDILDEMFREIQSSKEDPAEYFNRLDSLLAAWKKEFVVKLNSVA